MTHLTICSIHTRPVIMPLGISMRTAGAIIGTDILLMVEYNQSLSPNEAIRRIRMLETFDLGWVEEPVIAEDLQEHARIRAAVKVNIQTGGN